MKCLFSFGSRLLLLVVSLAAIARPSLADDYFLTIGGGYSPKGNQASLEKNVLFFQRLLDQSHADEVHHHILFSDGDKATRDLQYHDPDFQLPRANRLLARIFRQEKYLGYQYRNHEIAGVQGASTRENLEQWFDEQGSQLGSDDRLIIYVTAHGGRAPKKEPFNTSVYLWGRDSYRVKDFASLLDKVPEDVPVVVVMVQCFAGGFANIVFSGAEAEQGLSPANRCGFFATVPDRVAAGCTADINEENYHEYSSYFWAAVGGETRTGQPVENCDYDGDGRISFAEAHAYVLLTSVTIDISTKTSDAFLRTVSATSVEELKERCEEDNWLAQVSRQLCETPEASDDLELLTENTPYDELFERADPCQQVVLEGLSRELNLSGGRRAAEARRLLDKTKEIKKEVSQQSRKKGSQMKRVCKRIEKELLLQWPELANPWSPQVARILEEQADEVVAAVESHEDFDRCQRLHEEREQLQDQRLDYDRKLAKCQRLIRTLQEVALAANLPQVASPEIQERYQRLVEAEKATLAAGPTVTAE